MPTVTEETTLPGGWDDFYDWIAADGPGIILKWARDYVEKNGHVKVSDKPPMTERKRMLIDETRSAAQVLTTDLVGVAKDWSVENQRQFILVDADVIDWLRTRLPDNELNQLKPSRIRQWLKSAGMFEVKGRYKIDKRYSRCCASTAALAANILSATDVAEWRVTPGDNLFAWPM
jgi:hypothetical protein